MSRLIRVSILAVSALAIAAGAYANIPDPALSDVPAAITLSPGTIYDGNPIGTYVVHVEGPIGAVNGALVEVEVSPDADVLIGWCGNPYNQIHPLLTAFSDANGDASFTFYGGGCIDPDEFEGASFIAQVRANTIPLGQPYLTSPDAVNSQGRTATQTEESNCTGGSTEVGLSDAVYHTRPIKLALPDEVCTKMTPPFDGPIEVVDAVFLTPYIKNSNICACQPLP